MVVWTGDLRRRDDRGRCTTRGDGGMRSKSGEDQLPLLPALALPVQPDDRDDRSGRVRRNKRRSSGTGRCEVGWGEWMRGRLGWMDARLIGMNGWGKMGTAATKWGVQFIWKDAFYRKFCLNALLPKRVLEAKWPSGPWKTNVYRILFFYQCNV